MMATETMQTTGPVLYVASRASVPERSALWRQLRADGWAIASTWIDESGEGETECFVELWGRVEREIRASDGLVLYAEREDFPLKGALIEVGMALGMGKPVAVVLPGPPFLEPRSQSPLGSWLHHANCLLCPSLAAARDWIASCATPVANGRHRPG